MRSFYLRFAALSVGVALLASCDTRLGMPAGLGGSSNSSGGGGSTNLSITFNTPPEGTSMVAGDPLVVEVVLHDDQQLSGAALAGVTGADLATATVRYGVVTIPAVGSFPTGLRDTTVRATLQPINAGDVRAGDMRIVAIVRNAATADTVTRVVTLVSP